MGRHDHGYKLLFSNPRTVEDLLRGFVHEDWVSRLEFGTLERVNGSFIHDDLKGRQNDVVWRMRWRGEGEDGWFYLYVLLEFQSTPDHFMAVRLLVYVGLLLQELIRGERLRPGERLPPILPIVLYNGKRPWRAPLDLASLFTPVPPGLERRLPRLDYLLVDENRLTRKEKEQSRNLVAALFRLETCAPEDLPRLTRDLSSLLPPGVEPELRRAFTAWLLSMLHQTFRGATIPVVEDLEEVPMLEETLIEWRDEAQRTGSRLTLLRLMERRFGRLPKRVRTQVEGISSQRELNRLTDKILEAKSLQEMGLE
jgi:hypothetical protein